MLYIVLYHSIFKIFIRPFTYFSHFVHVSSSFFSLHILSNICIYYRVLASRALANRPPRLFLFSPYPIYAESIASTSPSPVRRPEPWPGARRRRWHRHRRLQLRRKRWTHTGTRLSTHRWWICNKREKHRQGESEWQKGNVYEDDTTLGWGMSFHMIKVNIPEIMLRYKLHTMSALFLLPVPPSPFPWHNPPTPSAHDNYAHRGSTLCPSRNPNESVTVQCSCNSGDCQRSLDTTRI